MLAASSVAKIIGHLTIVGRTFICRALVRSIVEGGRDGECVGELEERKGEEDDRGCSGELHRCEINVSAGECEYE
jgi:hypothetical protein